MMKSIKPFFQPNFVSDFARDILLKMDPEIAHRASINVLKFAPISTLKEEKKDSKKLHINLCGLELKNPIGLAAGFDKNGEVAGILGKIGFGFSEVGTVTPRPQKGNIKPRLFRLMSANAIINRMGFNNDGHEEVYARLIKQKSNNIIGVNIGANRDSEDFINDYVLGVKKFANIADYLTVNISSPNTKGIRDLQAGEILKKLLFAILAQRAKEKIYVPIFLKLSPDLDERQMDEIAQIIGESNLDGLIISNTTISRPNIAGLKYSDEMGGLSGKPLFNLATKRLAQMRQRVGKEMPIIGVGGIFSSSSAIAKLTAGANAIQLYSALIFSGIKLLTEIKEGMEQALIREKYDNISAFSNMNIDDWANGKMEI